MIAGTIWNQLKSTLEKSPTLKGYIKYVFEGRRFNIEPDSLPCLMLDPVSNNEILKETSTVKDLAMEVDIFAFSTVNFNDQQRTIVGDRTYKGIYDIENDVRAVLQSSNTLGGIVIDTISGKSLFDQIDVDKYPVRGVKIPITIKFRQIGGV